MALDKGGCVLERKKDIYIYSRFMNEMNFCTSINEGTAAEVERLKIQQGKW